MFNFDHKSTPPPDASTQLLHCIFYSHPWTALMLDKIKSIDFADSILIELATDVTLSLVFPLKKEERRGLVRFLSLHKPNKKGLSNLFSSKKTDVFDAMAQKCAEMPAPLIFAPEPRVSALNQIATLLTSAIHPSAYTRIIALIHYEEAQSFTGLYDYVDKFHLLWDIADLPGLKLTELTQLLVNNHHLNTERWGGFHLCHHPSRPLADLEYRQAFFESVIDDYQLSV